MREVKNVLDRYYKTSLKYQPKYIVRITADCPLIDFQIVDKLTSIAERKFRLCDEYTTSNFS